MSFYGTTKMEFLVRRQKLFSWSNFITIFINYYYCSWLDVNWFFGHSPMLQIIPSSSLTGLRNILQTLWRASKIDHSVIFCYNGPRKDWFRNSNNNIASMWKLYPKWAFIAATLLQWWYFGVLITCDHYKDSKLLKVLLNFLNNKKFITLLSII